VQDVFGVHGRAGIRIAADDVELHLGGFEIVGCPGSLDGISVANEGARVVLHAGVIRGWGRAGVDAQRARRCELDDLAINDNAGESIVVGGQTVIRNCRCFGNAGRSARSLWRLAV
jgi:hypothetical protein